MSAPALLEIKDLKKEFRLKYGVVDAFMRKPRKVLKAVDGVSFNVHLGESFGIVGESGCGKSTLAKTIMRLYRPDSGSITLNGRDISHLTRAGLRKEARSIQMIFQDPYSSLNPRMSVRETLKEALKVHKMCASDEMDDRIIHLLGLVGLNDYQADRMPGEFSGGQRQRIGIARALALEPRIIIADEPVSALDVSIQAQVINLLLDLREQLELTTMFISHDLRVVKYISNRVAVMYLGKIVELANSDDLFRKPQHPYSQILIKAAPSLDRKNNLDTEAVRGNLPSPTALPSGCRFHPRCPFMKESCRESEPVLSEISPGHFAACHAVSDTK